MSKKRLIENISLLYVLQGANYLVPLIVIPYLVRILGAEKFGLVAFSQAFMQYFVILTDYGFNLTATKKIARSKSDPQVISKTCINVITIKFLMLLLSAAMLLAIVFGFPKFSADWKIYIASFSMVVGSALFPIWYFQGIEQMRMVMTINLLGKIAAALSIFILVKHSDDVVLAALLQGVGFLIVGILGLGSMFYFGKIKLIPPSYKEIREELVDGWHVFLSTAAVSVYAASNAFLLGIFSTTTAVGYFSAADKIVKALYGLATPVFQSIYPHLNSMAVSSQRQAKLFLQKITKMMGGASLAISVATFIFAPLIIRIIFGKEFEPAIEVLRWMSAIPFIAIINTVFGMLTMLTFGMSKTLTRIVVTAGIFNIVVIVPLVRLYEASGAAIALSASEILVLIMMILALRKQDGFFHFRKLRNEETEVS